MTDVSQQLRKQMEFYFSDANIARDNYLKGKIAETEDGTVPLSEFLKFKRVSALTSSVDDIAKSLEGSDSLTLSEDKKGVRRTAPLPESLRLDERSAYVKFVPSTASLEELEKFFGEVAPVSAIWRRYLPGKDKTQIVKDSVFVVFDSEASVEKLLAAPPKFGEVQLHVEKKVDYLARKGAEKNKTGKSARPEAASAPKPELPKDSTVSISAVGTFAAFADVKNMWSADDAKGIRYVYLTPEGATVLFQDVATREKLVKDAEDKGTTVNGKVPKFTVLSGADEENALKKIDAEIVSRFHGRGGQQGRGGRGGGRGGRGGRGRGHGGKRPRD